MPEAKPRDINVLRVLSLLDDDKSTLLVPETKSRDTNMPFFFSFFFIWHMYSNHYPIQYNLYKLMYVNLYFGIVSDMGTRCSV